MPELHGRATFPGIDQVLACTYTLLHGITPGTATLEIVPQTDFIAAGGDLVLFDGETELTFRDCKVDQSSIRVSSGGFVTYLTIFDRRWRWSFGSLSGTYNRREEDGKLDSARLATPQQLATLALRAMGEQGFDVSQMPNNVFPLVEWDHDNPAEMLADLAGKVGCRVVLRLDGTVQVARAGVGAQLPRPRGLILEDSLTINPPERPDGITFVCGPTRFQVDFVLEPVGKDIDGKIKPIDLLSYRPTGGWIGHYPPYFGGVSDTPTATGIVPRDLAKKTVYRWYRIQNVDLDGNVGLIVPGYPFRIRDIRQVLPLEDIQVEAFVDAADDKTKSLPAVVSGDFWDGDFSGVSRNDAVYTAGFDIDQALGVVQFDDYVIQFDEDDEVIPAELQLRCAVSVRDFQTWALVRYERTLFFQGPRFGTGTQQVRVDKVQLNVVGDPVNEPDVVREADRQLAIAAAAYQTPLPQEIAYAGLIELSPDGAIQQVTWSIGPGGTTSRASRNDEFTVVAPSFEQRRVQERLRGDKLPNIGEMESEFSNTGGNKNRVGGMQAQRSGVLL